MQRQKMPKRMHYTLHAMCLNESEHTMNRMDKKKSEKETEEELNQLCVSVIGRRQRSFVEIYTTIRAIALAWNNFYMWVVEDEVTKRIRKASNERTNGKSCGAVFTLLAFSMRFIFFFVPFLPRAGFSFDHTLCM